MADTKKNPAVAFVTEVESVRLANCMIRVAWKSIAGAIALAARLLTAIILAIARAAERNRTNW